MHIAEVVTIAKSLPLLRLNTYKSLILSYSADYRRILKKNLFPNASFAKEEVCFSWSYEDHIRLKYALILKALTSRCCG